MRQVATNGHLACVAGVCMADSNMKSPPDAVQEWVSLWLQQMCNNRQEDSLPQTQNQTSKEFMSVVMQTWQQSCDLWANGLMASLPEAIVAPIADSLKRSQNDLQQIMETAAAAHKQTLEDSGNDVTRTGPFTNSGITVDPLWVDPLWNEHLFAFNAFVQLHIRHSIKCLEKIKDELAQQPDVDLTAVLQSTSSNWQTAIYDTEYQQVLRRLLDSFLALSMPVEKER